MLAIILGLVNTNQVFCQEIDHQPRHQLHTFNQIYQNVYLFNHYRSRNIPPFSNPFHLHHHFNTLKHFPVIQNLTVWINYLVATRNCLTVIDNWQGVDLDLHSLHSPVIIRSPQPAIIWKRTTQELVSVWIPQDTKLIIKIANNTESPLIIKCPMSKFFMSFKLTLDHSHILKDICVKLNATRFTASSKPWNEKIHIGMHIPLYLTESVLSNGMLTYPELLGFSSDLSWSDRNFGSSITSNIPTVYCFVSHLKISETGYAQIAGLIEGFAFKPKTDNQESGVLHDVYLWASVSLTGNVKECHIVRNPGISDSHNKLLKHFHISKEINIMTNFSNASFYEFAYVPQTQQIGLYVWHFEDDKTFGAIQQHWTICRNHITHWPRKLTGIPFATKTDRIAHAHVHLWQSVLRNYTVYSNKLSSCVSDKRSTAVTNIAYANDLSLELRIHSDQVPLYYPVVIEDTINRLRFVACGHRGISSFLFDQLVAVFDTYIWICMAATILALTEVKRRYLFPRKLTYFWKALIDELGFFLDQINQIGNSKTSTGSYLILQGITLLMGIILTNAYKNTNVLNMITTRDSMLYTKFNELIHDNFQVYPLH